MSSDTSQIRQLRDDPGNQQEPPIAPTGPYTIVPCTDGTYKLFACDEDAPSPNKRTKVWTLDIMGQPNQIYTISSTIDLGNRIVEIPENCTIIFVGDGQFVNGTLISKNTRFVNLPRCDSNGHSSNPNPTNPADIIGKLFNINGQEITVRGDVINRSTPVLFSHLVRYCTGYNEDSFNLCRGDNIPRNIGITDCLLQLHVLGNDLLDACVTGGWGVDQLLVANTPSRIAQEVYVNGLNVKGIKFHSKVWRGSMYDYRLFVSQYTQSLIEEFQLLNLPLFTDVYIVNERGDWTDRYSLAIPEIRTLANIVSSYGLVPRVAFAGINQMLKADPLLYDCIKPAANFYPSLTFLDDELDDFLTDSTDLELRIKQRIEQEFEAITMEYFPENTCFWGSDKNLVFNLALSEIGVKPYEKALRAPERYDDTALGSPYKYAVTVFWQTIKRLASQMNFEYIDLYYSNELYDRATITGLADEMYDLLIDF